MILDAGGKALNRTDPSPYPPKKKTPHPYGADILVWGGETDNITKT